MTHLLKLAFPVALAHLGFITMGLIDLYAVRSFGASATGAVGIATSFFGWSITLGVGVLAGMDFYVSTAFGAGRFKDCDRTLVQGVWLSTVLGIPLTYLMWMAADHLAFFGVQREVAEKARPFMQWLALSILPSFWFCAFRNYLQAISKVWPAFITLFLANVGNFFLNFLFIEGNSFIPAMGFEGCAIATLSVRVLMVIVIVALTVYARRSLNGPAMELGLSAWQTSWERMKPIIKLGIPAAGYMLLEVSVFGLSTIFAARLEPNALAAHQIVLNLASAAFMIPLGIGSATAVLVGQNLGGRHFVEARATGWRGLVLASLFMFCSGMSFILLSTIWMEPFTEDVAVLLIGAQVLKVAAFFQISDGAQTALAGALRGVGNTRSAFYANFVGHWVFGFPLGLWLCFSLKWGVVGIWMGLALGLGIVAIWLTFEWWRISHGVVRDGEAHLSKYFAASRTS
jgi:multidrug resistance protein, MATE family